MPSTFTNSLRLVKPAPGELDSTWGSVFNQQFSDLVDVAIAGISAIAMADADIVLTAANGIADQARAMVLSFTGELTASRNVVVPTTSKLSFVQNNTSGGFELVVKTASGSGVGIPNGGSAVVFCDGVNVISPVSALPFGTTVDGFIAGYLDIPQNSRSADYTLQLSDAGKHIFHPTSDTTARAWTIPANSSVAFRVGTAITFANELGAGAVTLEIDTDTLIFAGLGTTGSRSLLPSGIATALKVAPTVWMISGQGIT